MISLAQVQRAVLVVAHPDDESLWCGGLLARTAPRIRWTVLCCSVPRLDPIRAVRFVQACSALGVRHPVVLQHQETPPAVELPYLEEVLHRWGLWEYDLVVTHGKNGEYGHVHHRQLYRLLVEEQVGLQCGMRPGPCPAVATLAARPGAVSLNGAMRVELTAKEWQGKLTALRCYDHRMAYRGRVLPKWEALLLEYGTRFDLQTEAYDGLCS